MRRLPLLFTVLLLVSACAAPSPVIQVESLRFHRPDATSIFAFVILPQADQSDEIYGDYAELIAHSLQSLGWRRQQQADGAAVILRFRWGVDAPVTETVLSPSVVPPMGPWSQRRPGLWNDPFPSWQAQRVVSYAKWLTVTMADASDASAPPLFEGRVVTRRGGAEIGPVMPYLVRGMFDGFPGANGATEAKALPVQP
ncbi:DUF4136 domain-containing protein [Magnetospirillum sulfuroxidans]|uniref:DUF4136 domain-containing protein n=1 Tax=Magnetospirillum sulfuroxidans TaxID=611300 RepID=A0ABS5IDL8_9PROT|nr:DUF4136 domain-containing protein [Magnetospirillum sulfuroxidans]MBR9972524.1 hypothetical protein [Magnetospirillum sulfuroxidans]